MSWTKGIVDIISDSISPIIRKLNDIETDTFGTKVSLLRITKTAANYLGDQDYTLSAEVIENCILEYPESEMELFQTLSTSTVSDSAIDLWEILPIILTIQFEGTYASDIIKINNDDLFVDLRKDDYGNTIPIVLQVIRKRGDFFFKNLVQVKYQLSLQRGTLETAIQTIIDDYAQTPTVDLVDPDDGTEDVSVDTPIIIDFNMRMASGVVEDNFWISGVVNGVIPTTNTWNTNLTRLTATPDSDLGSGVVYTVHIGESAQSNYSVELGSDYETTFTTYSGVA